MRGHLQTTSMQRESVRRGFGISHQKVVLQTDIGNRSAHGYTELTIVPLSRDLKTIHLHARCDIHSVGVTAAPGAATIKADFVHHDPTQAVTVSNPADVHLYPELKRRLFGAAAEADEGELSIAIPTSFALHPSNAPVDVQGSERPDLPPFILVIEYSVHDPKQGLEFVLPTDSHPHHVPHVFTSPVSPDAARCWVPCLDSLWERCTWELVLIAPHSLERPAKTRPDEMALDQPVAEPEPEFPVIAHIAFAIGPFIAHTVPDPTAADPTTTTSTPTPIRTYALPCSSNASLELATTSAPLRPAMSFYTTEYGSYPFGTLSVVFLPTVPTTTSYDAAGLVLLPTTLLHTPAYIDAAFDARLALAHALAAQWAGVHIVPRTPTDNWLVLGLQGYVAGLCIRRLLGNNEWRFRLKADTARCVALDDGSYPPISRPSCARSFVRLKAPLVLHTLDRILGAHGGLGRVLPKIFLSALSGELAQNALGTTAFVRMCRKLGGGSGGGGASGGGGVGGEVRVWARQWIYGSGCPRFYVSAGFSRKKMAVELTVEQRCLAWERNGSTAANVNVEYNPIKSFEGQMAVRIHEADGTPYEHILDLRDGRTKFEVPFNTKYKRVRRRRRGEAPILENGAVPEGENPDMAAGVVGGMVGGGGAVFEYAPWDDAEARVAWHVEEFEDAEPLHILETAYEWIRLDAEMSWLARIELKQPGIMWASQLTRERDVGAQLESIWAFGGGLGSESGLTSGLGGAGVGNVGSVGGGGVITGMSPGSYSSFAAIPPSGAVSTALAQTVLVPSYFFRVRCAAARALAAQGAPGLFHLLKIWTKWCYEPGNGEGGDGFAQRFIPRPNDFSDFQEYFVRKAVIGALARLRDGTTGSWMGGALVRCTVVDQLVYNDNTGNPYSDDMYIATLITALAASLIPPDMSERNELINPAHNPDESEMEEVARKMAEEEENTEVLRRAAAQVERYRSRDRLVPSRHNSISIAVVEWYMTMMMCGLVTQDPRLFLAYSQEANAMGLRLAAMDALLLTKWWRNRTLIQYIFAVIAHDPSREVRRHVSRALLTSLPVLHALGELRPAGKDEPLLLIEDDGSMPAKDKAKKGESELLVKTLKREIGRSKQLRDSIMPIMLAPDADHEVRATCEAQDHSPNSSPTPISETPPQPPTSSAASSLPKKPLPVVRQTPTSLKISLPQQPASLPKLKLVGSAASPRTSAGALPPLVPPVVPSPLAIDSTPRRNVVQLPEAPAIPAPAPVPAPLPAPEPESATIPLPRPKKIKPPAPAPAPQAINKTTYAHCRAVLNAINRNPHANLFRLPVDPVRDQAPNYFDVIKNPMDLSTMKAKLDNRTYRDRAGFESDFKLMIQNAKTYNPPKTYAYNEAVALEKVFNDRWTKIDANASAAQALEMESAPPLASTSKSSFSIPPAPTPSGSAAPSRRVTLVAHPKSSNLLETPTRTKPNPSLLPGTDTTPRPKNKAKIEAPSPSPADQKSRTPKIKIITLPNRIGPLPRPAPRAPSPPPPPPPPPPPAEPDPVDDTDPLEDMLLEEVLAIETETEKKKEKNKAAALSREHQSTPAPPPFRSAPGSGSATPVPLKIGKTTLKIPRPSTPSVASAVEKKPSRPSTPSMDGASDRERTPTVTTKVRIIERPSKSTTPSIQKTKDAGVREKASSKDPFAVLLGSSSKGKAKEPAPPPPPAAPAISGPGSQKIDLKRCERILASLKRVENATMFERPVDPIRDGCPTYLDEIAHPMDLGTMGTKLRSGKYKIMEDFKKDFELVISNCKQFNPSGTFPVIIAENLEAAFKREWTKLDIEPRKISSGDRRALVTMIDKLSEQPCALWFLTAVDPVQQNVPDYYKIIPKRDARDLAMIKSNIERGHYDSFEALTADMYLMQANAAKFNGDSSQVAADARTFVKSYEVALANFKRKRKGPEVYAGGGKKQKLV
ncbi:bromodomain associated protein [Ceratobasidium sp. AG-Ba]|nr:bromodomain associated protein [Ceratobasidium sp. AG-Ba]